MVVVMASNQQLKWGKDWWSKAIAVSTICLCLRSAIPFYVLLMFNTLGGEVGRELRTCTPSSVLKKFKNWSKLFFSIGFKFQKFSKHITLIMQRIEPCETTITFYENHILEKFREGMIYGTPNIIMNQAKRCIGNRSR